MRGELRWLHPFPRAVCSLCGQMLEREGACLACLLSGGLDESEKEPLPSNSLVFGDFEIERRDDGSFWELGRGAMGVTYRARDKVLHRPVALKVIEVPAKAEGAHATRERFLREARAAAALRHANVASVFQFGAPTETGRCYYAMELVEGETLETLVRRDGPLPVEAALEIAIQVTRALVAAAAHGLIHRDLKPANIMLAPNEVQPAALEAKVIDFGLAKATAEAAGRDGHNSWRICRHAYLRQSGAVCRQRGGRAIGHLFVRRDALVRVDGGSSVSGQDNRGNPRLAERGRPTGATAKRTQSSRAFDQASAPNPRHQSGRATAVRAGIVRRARALPGKDGSSAAATQSGAPLWTSGHRRRWPNELSTPSPTSPCHSA